MQAPRVPRSLLTNDRTEHTGLELELFEGALPPDLVGHVFAVAPVGTLGTKNGERDTTMVVGDGMVCRFDLGPNGVSLTNRLVRGHDLVADELTQDDPSLSRFRFGNSGLGRGGVLGTRDFSNTAFVPMTKNGGAEPTRMLVTYDAGRPVEIDTKTLEFATPVGRRTEWDPEVFHGGPFPTVLTPAHPAYDPEANELLTINYGRGLASIAATVPAVGFVKKIPKRVDGNLDRSATVLGMDRVYRWFRRRNEKADAWRSQRVEDFITEHLPKQVPDSFTDLVRWDGEGALERFRIVLMNEHGNPRELHIQQSVHQVAITRNHVLILETGFKIGVSSTFNNPLRRTDIFEKAARVLTTKTQLPYTVFYIVRRADMDSPMPPLTKHGLPRVECRRVKIPIEADHFLADFDDTNGIRVHVGHAPATDLSEWIRPYDVSGYDFRPISKDLHGMLAVGAMDVGRFGRYVIDTDTYKVVSSEVIVDEPHSWAIGLYAGAGINTHEPPPERFEQIYWATEGLFPELLTEFVRDLYADYVHRLVPLEKIAELGATGRPSCVLRIDTETMTYAEVYELPSGVMAGSLQFVPRPGGGATNGYLVGTFYTNARTELWVFDAADLKKGPVAKLAAEKWKIGFSLHTAWLPEVSERTADYHVSAREEIEEKLSKLWFSSKLRKTFEQKLYPLFDD